MQKLSLTERERVTDSEKLFIQHRNFCLNFALSKETESDVQIEELWQNNPFLAAYRTTISNTPIDVIPISSNEFEQHSKRKDYVKVIHQIIEVNEF